jgi:hypothetical protein
MRPYPSDIFSTLKIKKSFGNLTIILVGSC